MSSYELKEHQTSTTIIADFPVCRTRSTPSRASTARPTLFAKRTEKYERMLAF